MMRYPICKEDFAYLVKILMTKWLKSQFSLGVGWFTNSLLIKEKIKY
jgi:hypothetical protein